MRTNLLWFGVALAAVAFSGCTVRQDEPFRIEVVTVDGGSREARLDADDDDGRAEKEFRLAITDDVDRVTVIVEVTNVAIAGGGGGGGFIGDDDDDGDDGNDTGNATGNDTGNQTGNGTGGGGGDGGEPAVILVIIEDRDGDERLAEQRVEARDQASIAQLDVDVRGKDNIVIITQAVQGSADVSVKAESGGETDDDGGMGNETAGNETGNDTGDDNQTWP